MLKNPLNLVMNFSEASLELIEDVVAALGPHRGDLPGQVQRELDYLLPELVQNMKDLRIQGERGDAIIRSMLLHSRTDAGDRTLDNLSTLVRDAQRAPDLTYCEDIARGGMIEVGRI